MNADRWDKIELICFDAVDIQGEERDTFLINACAGDTELLKEVQSLLNYTDSELPHYPFVNTQSSFVFSDEHTQSEKVIGPYRLIREIASGGMGQVYLAVRDDEQFKRFVAVKVIRKDFVSDDILSRFYEERQILASLNHPNIARLFDGGTTAEEIPWFAMEFVEGQIITEHCESRNLTVNEKIELFKQVCAAVQYAHQNLVIHRDLKPANILITSNGTPKLLDFGIAKLIDLEQKSGQTQYQHRLMTPEYASPELVKNEPVSTVSDVYSLGVLLYELLAGTLPYRFEKKNPVAIEHTVCTVIPPLPSLQTGSKELQGDLDCIIMKALKKDPSERYASVEQMVNDLVRYQQSLPVLAQKDSFAYSTRKFIHRNTWSVAVSAIIGLLIVTFSAVTFLQSRAIEARAIEAELQRDRAEQVSNFLTNLFESVNPDEAKDNALSAIELLHRGAERVETELSGQPVAQSNLYLVISDVYESLGLYDFGLEMAWKADSIQHNLYSGNHPEIARTLNAFGWLYFKKGDSKQADSLLSAALFMRKNMYGNLHLDVARSLNDLAVLRQAQGDYDATDTLLLGAIQIRKQLKGVQEEALGVALSNYAALKYGLGDFEAAEQQMREALEIFQVTVGDNDMRTANVMSNLAAILTVRKNMQGASDYYHKALNIRLKLLGEEHPDVASSYAHLGNFLRGNKEYIEAEKLLLKAFQLRKDILGEEHILTNDSKRVLGILYQDTGNLKEAEKYYLESLEAFRSIYPEVHAETAEVLYRLGNLYLTTNSPAKAEPPLREALHMREQIFQGDNAITAEYMIKLGFCLNDLGEPKQAKKFISKGIETLYKTENGLENLRIEAEKVLSTL